MNRRCQGGFTYLGMLAAIAILSAVLGSAAEVWHTERQQEKERELLFIGHQFRLAIERYYRASSAGGNRYPASLEDLVKDPRQPGVQRYLRRIWRDPVTGKAEWGLVQGPAGEIMGVHSLSEERPLKAAKFDPEDAAFAQAEKYSDWLFVYQPRRLGQRLPASSGAGGTAKPPPAP